MGRVDRKNTFYDKRTHFEKRKNEHKPINNNQLRKLPPDRPNKNEPISNPFAVACASGALNYEFNLVNHVNHV
jgi:hypothetical protein